MDSERALLALSALAHATRLAAFRVLVQTGAAGLAVGELREQLAIPPATLSAHLNQLRQAGLVDDVREGRVIRVSANYAQMEALIGFLTDNCCAGLAECHPVTGCSNGLPPDPG